MRSALTLSFCILIGSLAVSAPAFAVIHNVNMEGISFVPPSLTIATGDEVLWTNMAGSIIHTTTSGAPCTPDQIWNSGNLGNLGTFQFKFVAAGTYEYFCIPHCGLSMRGTIIVEDPIGSGIDDAVPASYRLRQNYPNPFNPTTTIEYTLLAPARVEIEIFNAKGKLVKRVESAVRDAGTFTAQWDATNTRGVRQASGIYFYQLKLNDVAVEMRKMVLLK